MVEGSSINSHNKTSPSTSDTGPTLSVSAPTVLFEGIHRDESDVHFAQYVVGPGDVGFVMVRADDTPEQRRIHVMLNWFEELRRLAPAN